MIPRSPASRSTTLVVLTVLAFSALDVVIYGWALMLGLGVAHAEFGWPPSPIGWWPSLSLGAVFVLLFKAGR